MRTRHTSIRMSPISGTRGRIQLQLGCEDPNHSKNIFSEGMQGLYHIWELGHGLDQREINSQHLQIHYCTLWLHRLICRRWMAFWLLGGPRSARPDEMEAWNLDLSHTDISLRNSYKKSFLLQNCKIMDSVIWHLSQGFTLIFLC